MIIVLKEGDVRIFDPLFVSSTSKTVAVRDSDGNTTRVSVDDPRYISGELVPANKGSKYSSKGKKRVRKDGKEKYILPSELDKYISLGWSNKRK